MPLTKEETATHEIGHATMHYRVHGRSCTCSISQNSNGWSGLTELNTEIIAITQDDRRQLVLGYAAGIAAQILFSDNLVVAEKRTHWLNSLGGHEESDICKFQNIVVVPKDIEVSDFFWEYAIRNALPLLKKHYKSMKADIESILKNGTVSFY